MCHKESFGLKKVLRLKLTKIHFIPAEISRSRKNLNTPSPSRAVKFGTRWRAINSILGLLSLEEKSDLIAPSPLCVGLRFCKVPTFLNTVVFAGRIQPLRQRGVQFPAVFAGPGLGSGPPARRVPSQVGVARTRISSTVADICGRRHSELRGGPHGGRPYQRRGHGRRRCARPHAAVHQRSTSAAAAAVLQRPGADRRTVGRAAAAVPAVPRTDRLHRSDAGQTGRPVGVQPGRAAAAAHRHPAEAHQARFGQVVVAYAATTAPRRRRCRRRRRRPT